MPLDLALDRATGECRERHTDLGVEPIDRLDERQHRDLLDVVVSPGRSVVALGDVHREAHVLFDDAIADAAAPGAPELGEQLSAVSVGGHRPRHA